MTSAQFAHETPSGVFVRQANRFTNRITRDSDSAPGDGPDPLGRWPVESGRYRLVWSRACPWAHGARIVWGLLGVKEVISLATVDPIRDEDGWRFTLDPVVGTQSSASNTLQSPTGRATGLSPAA